MAHSLLTLQVVVYKLLRPTGGLCILNKYSVNFVAGEHEGLWGGGGGGGEDCLTIYYKNFHCSCINKDLWYVRAL